MNRCPITYEDTANLYSSRGLRLLHRSLQDLLPLAFNEEQLRQEAIARAGKMSIQGVQLKVSAILDVKRARFELVNRNGFFILKPPSRDYPELPANEDLTMRMAKAAGISVPLHGLVFGSDNSLTYFVRRFDRIKSERIPMEDFSQLTGGSRDTKYDSSMEKVAWAIEKFCTFPVIEKVKLFERTLFSFLTGNEDMHLKNFSLMINSQKVELTPAYDLVNSTIALPNPKEEMALPLNGKKSKLTRNDLFKYYAIERLGLNQGTIVQITSNFTRALPLWLQLLERSFLSPNMKAKYRFLLKERCERMNLAWPSGAH